MPRKACSPLVDPFVWALIQQTFRTNPNVFLKGSGDITKRNAVRLVTGHDIPENTIRRVLLAGVNQHKATILPGDTYTRYQISKYKLT